MSRHVSRESRWTKINAKEYRSSFGLVAFRAGAWEGTVLYETRTDDPLGTWQPETAYAGRFKRPRNAMISVEDKAVEIRRRGGERVRVLIEKD